MKVGLLLTSTDYWPEKITNTKHVLSRGAPDKVFDRKEIEDAIAIGEKSALKLIVTSKKNIILRLWSGCLDAAKSIAVQTLDGLTSPEIRKEHFFR